MTNAHAKTNVIRVDRLQQLENVEAGRAWRCALFPLEQLRADELPRFRAEDDLHGPVQSVAVPVKLRNLKKKSAGVSVSTEEGGAPRIGLKGILPVGRKPAQALASLMLVVALEARGKGRRRCAPS